MTFTGDSGRTRGGAVSAELMRSIAVAILVVNVAAIITQSATATAGAAAASRTLEFSCRTFPPTVSENALMELFGRDHVRTALVDGGGADGEQTPGTVLFPEEPNAKVQILWKLKEPKTNPFLVWIEGSSSRWRTPEGISFGTDLHTIERINRRPFRMAGFGFDGSGTVTSWTNGQLNTRGTGCQMQVSLGFEPASAHAKFISRQVIGDHDFSSGHPAMQELNPRVYKMFIDYSR